MSVIDSIRISIDYDQLITQAMRLEKAADAYGEGTRKLTHEGSSLLEHWQGEAAQALFLKITEVIKERNFTQQELREKAAQLRQIAENIKWADYNAAVEFHQGSGRF